VSRIVVKVGGAVADASAAVILDLVTKSHEVCVVHGAGPQISLEMERAGINVEFVDGRRVTSPAGLEIVRASFQRVNTLLCEAIGERAVPLFGDEIGLEATPVPELGLAVGLGVDELLFLTDVDGLILDGSIVDEIGIDAATELLDGGTLEGGIIPKLGAAVTAARGGVAATIGRTAVTA